MSSPKFKSILIVDEHPLTRIGYQQIVSKIYPDSNYYFAKDSSEFVVQIESRKFDLIFLSLNLPERPCIELLEFIKLQNHDSKVIAIIDSRTRLYYSLVDRFGIIGVLNKEDNLFQIEEVIKKAQSYEFMIHFKNLSKGNRTEMDFNQNEKLMIKLLLNGFTNKQLAEKFNLRISTIRSKKNRILKKCGLKSSILLHRHKGIIEFVINNSNEGQNLENEFLDLLAAY
jgi:DNA-binding NarL/FixJ family response regulator